MSKYSGDLQGYQIYQLQKTNKQEILSLQSHLATMIPGGAYHSDQNIFLSVYLLTSSTIYLLISPHAPPLASPAWWLTDALANLCHPRSYREK